MYIVSCADPLVHGEGNTRSIDMARATVDTAGFYGPVHGWKLQTREPGDPISMSEEVTDSGLKTPQEAQQA